MKFLRATAGYIKQDKMRNMNILEEFKKETVLENIQEYRDNWPHVKIMHLARIPQKLIN